MVLGVGSALFNLRKRVPDVFTPQGVLRFRHDTCALRQRI